MSETSPEQSLKPSNRGLKRIYNAFFYSMDGLKATFQGEDAFRQECLLAAVLIPIALLSSVSIIGKVLLISSVIVLLIVEVLNSAIEAVVDRISLEHHELSKKAKDMGSAAVFLSMLLLGVAWIGIWFFE